MTKGRQEATSGLAASRALLQCVGGQARAELAKQIACPDFDWASFWELAQQQHVAPLVARMLEHKELSAVLSPEAKQRARDSRWRTLLYNMGVHSETERIGEMLRTASIPVIPLKGTQLAVRLFGDVGARRCGDIDLLVPESQYEYARLRLIQSGYVPSGHVKPGVERHAFHGLPLVRQGAGAVFQVELHWGLSDPRFVSIDPDRLWRRTLSRNGAASDLHMLPPEELLVFLSLHLPKHDSGLLRLVADIHYLIISGHEELDWEYVVPLAERWQADDMLYFSLSLARTLLNTPVPESVLQQLQPALWKRQLVHLLVGPGVILDPPSVEYLRISRFRIGYCLMLRPLRRTLRAYVHYILFPPGKKPRNAMFGVASLLGRPLVGVARTAAVFWTSCWHGAAGTEVPR